MNIDINKLLDSAELMVATQNYEKAISIYSQVIEENNNCDEAYLLRGELYGKLGQQEKAFDDVLKAISIDPEYDAAHLVLALLYQSQGDLDNAIQSCQQAVKLNKSNEEVKKLISQLYETMADKQLASHQPENAVENFQHALEFSADNLHLLYKHAFAVSRYGDFNQAKELAEFILDKNSSHVPTKDLLASIYEKTGEIKKGWDIIDALAKEYPNNPTISISFGKYALRNEQQAQAIERLESVLNHTDLKTDDRLSLHMLLGKLYDSIEDYKDAFGHFKKANSLKYNDYVIEEFRGQISGVIDYFSKEKFNEIPSSGNDSVAPIFILGMPRSGTSLIEQIVSSHSRVFGGGELQNVINTVSSMQANGAGLEYPQLLQHLNSGQLYQYASVLIDQMKSLSPEAEHITDKLPHNFQFIGLIHKLLPRAKIINCLRDPVDNCLSCYFQHFGGYHPYAYNLSHLGDYYHQYIRLMHHWEDVLHIPLLNVQYEDVVQDTKNEVKRLLDYLELDWEDSCLEFYNQSRAINTASYTQVKRKIYTGSVKRWMNYKPYIGDLIQSLQS